jgi:hypothetical protein
VRDPLRFLALWALLHDTADDAWTQAVARGRDVASSGRSPGPDAWTDALAAIVDEEKERLSRELLEGDRPESAADLTALQETLERLTFEVSELRGRMESLQTSVDALLERSDG